MNGDITLLTLFLLGFFGGGHCVGMCGGLSSAFALQLPPGLYLSANLLLLFLGLYLAGISSLATRIESIGRPVWKRLNPLLNRLLPIQSVPACFGVGMLWGWLPCGLVYSASLYALGSGNALEGGLYMLAFALGTLPNLLAMGLFAAQLKNFLQRKTVRLAAGLLVAAWALWRLVSFYVAF